MIQETSSKSYHEKLIKITNGDSNKKKEITRLLKESLERAWHAAKHSQAPQVNISCLTTTLYYDERLRDTCILFGRSLGVSTTLPPMSLSISSHDLDDYDDENKFQSNPHIFLQSYSKNPLLNTAGLCVQWISNLSGNRWSETNISSIKSQVGPSAGFVAFLTKQIAHKSILQEQNRYRSLKHQESLSSFSATTTTNKDNTTIKLTKVIVKIFQGYPAQYRLVEIDGTTGVMIHTELGQSNEISTPIPKHSCIIQATVYFNHRITMKMNARKRARDVTPPLSSLQQQLVDEFKRPTKRMRPNHFKETKTNTGVNHKNTNPIFLSNYSSKSPSSSEYIGSSIKNY